MSHLQDLRLKPLDAAYINARVSKQADGCWVWQPKGGTTAYGQLGRRVGGKYRALLAHRVSYEVFVGPIPEGLEIDHLCRVPKCVNPAHLQVVDRVTNVRRSSRWS